MAESNPLPLWMWPKRLARSLLSHGPLYALARLRALKGNAVTILMYHTLRHDDEAFDAWTIVRRSDFQRQIDWLRRHYAVVSLDEVLDARDGDGSRPRAVITFDDGEAGLYEHLLPIVEREHLPVTVYVATGQIESTKPYWFDRVMNAMQVTGPAVLDLAAVGLGCWSLDGSVGERAWRTTGSVLEALKALPPVTLEAASERIVAALAAVPGRRITPLAPLSLPQLRALAASRWVTIGAHTHGHCLLDQIPLTDASASIEQSRRLLRNWTGQAITHFAYPNGNHNEALVREVERLGFHSAMATGKGLWRPGDGRFAMQRVPVGRYDEIDKFRLDLLGGVQAAFVSAPAAGASVSARTD